MVCSFTACNTDIADDYPSVSVSLAAGEVNGNSLSFTLTANGADDVYYWVEKQVAEGEDAPELNIDDATYLDAQVDQTFEQVITETGLKYATSYTIYAYARNFAHSGYAQAITMTIGEAPVAVPAPQILSVVLDEEELQSDAFLMYVTTANVVKASWLVVAKYTEGVTAEQVLSEGVAISAGDLNGEAAVVVEDLQADTEYDFYVAAENSEGKKVLSDVVAVTTAKAALPVIEISLNQMMQSQDLSVIGKNGLLLLLADANSDNMAQLVLSGGADYPGYFAAGDYPALSGSIEGTVPSASCLLADLSYTAFMINNVFYSVVGDVAADEQGNPYYMGVYTEMPNVDNNLLEFNLLVVDEEGKQAVLQGSYQGPLGYPVATAAVDFNLTQWGFKEFKATIDGTKVKLVSTSVNGDFVINLETEDGTIKDNQAFVAGEGGNMTGGYTSYVEGTEEHFEFVSGRISFEKVGDDGSYKLHVAYSRGGGAATVPDWIMESQGSAYKIVAPEEGYSVKISFPYETLSLDGKQWLMPADFALGIVGQATDVVADLGVTAPGYLLFGASLEPIYGPDAAGQWQSIMSPLPYTISATDATSGVIAIVSTDHFGDVQTINLPYSNLTATSVTIDLTNMGMGSGWNCTLYTGNAQIGGGGTAM